MNLLEKDRTFVWHPYTQHGMKISPLDVQSAQGAYLYLTDGRKILDAISSWWVNIHGHCHPQIVESISQQAKQLDHVLFAGATHDPAVELAEILIRGLQERKINLSRVFYSDNGSTAVEVALKMSYQFHHNRGDRSRKRFIALRNSYHGDTLGTMAVGEPEGFHRQYQPLLTQHDFIETESSGIQTLEKLLDSRPCPYSAVIVEPMVQGAGGMKMISARFLGEVATVSKARGVHLICDEVFTGFYRTGKCFAIEHAGVSPDFLCLSKGITGGCLPLAATVTSEEIYSAFLSSELRHAFLHGHSYTANPIACAAAIASWKLLHEPESQERIRLISDSTAAHVERLAKLPNVAAARSLGTIGAVEIKAKNGDSSGYFSEMGPKLFEAALARGVLLRPLGNVLYSVPPYCINETELSLIYSTMAELASNVGKA